jgi:hypothetical protein
VAKTCRREVSFSISSFARPVRPHQNILGFFVLCPKKFFPVILVWQRHFRHILRNDIFMNNATIMS